MTPLQSYSPRTQSILPMLTRLSRPPADQPAARAGAEAGAEQGRQEAQPAAPMERAGAVTADTMGRAINVLRRVAGGEGAGEAVAAEARQVLSLLGAPLSQSDARRARLNVVA